MSVLVIGKLNSLVNVSLKQTSSEVTSRTWLSQKEIGLKEKKQARARETKLAHAREIKRLKKIAKK